LLFRLVALVAGRRDFELWKACCDSGTSHDFCASTSFWDAGLVVTKKRDCRVGAVVIRRLRETRGGLA
jgi:hypothetical protein